MVTAITPNIQSSICELSHDLLNLLMSLYNEVMKIFVSFQFKAVNAFSYVGLENINSMYIQIMQLSIKGDFILNKVRIKRNSPGKIRRLCCPLSPCPTLSGRPLLIRHASMAERTREFVLN